MITTTKVISIPNMSKSPRRSKIDKDEESYHPLAIKFTKKDGTPKQCNVFCGLSIKDFALILCCYIAFYSFLFGTSILLLKGVMATNESDAFLWGFLYIGILFCIGVMLAVILGSRTKKKQQKKKEKKEDKQKKVQETQSNSQLITDEEKQ